MKILTDQLLHQVDIMCMMAEKLMGDAIHDVFTLAYLYPDPRWVEGICKVMAETAEKEFGVPKELVYPLIDDKKEDEK